MIISIVLDACWYSKHSKVTFATCKNRFVLLFCATEHCPLNFLFRRNLLNSHGKNVLSIWLILEFLRNRSGPFQFFFQIEHYFYESIILQNWTENKNFLLINEAYCIHHVIVKNIFLSQRSNIAPILLIRYDRYADIRLLHPWCWWCNYYHNMCYFMDEKVIIFIIYILSNIFEIEFIN